MRVIRAILIGLLIWKDWPLPIDFAGATVVRVQPVNRMAGESPPAFRLRQVSKGPGVYPAVFLLPGLNQALQYKPHPCLPGEELLATGIRRTLG